MVHHFEVERIKKITYKMEAQYVLKILLTKLWKSTTMDKNLEENVSILVEWISNWQNIYHMSFFFFFVIKRDCMGAWILIIKSISMGAKNFDKLVSLCMPYVVDKSFVVESSTASNNPAHSSSQIRFCSWMLFLDRDLPKVLGPDFQ